MSRTSCVPSTKLPSWRQLQPSGKLPATSPSRKHRTAGCILIFSIAIYIVAGYKSALNVTEVSEDFVCRRTMQVAGTFRCHSTDSNGIVRALLYRCKALALYHPGLPSPSYVRACHSCASVFRLRVPSRLAAGMVGHTQV